MSILLATFDLVADDLIEVSETGICKELDAHLSEFGISSIIEVSDLIGPNDGQPRVNVIAYGDETHVLVKKMIAALGPEIELDVQNSQV